MIDETLKKEIEQAEPKAEAVAEEPKAEAAAEEPQVEAIEEEPQAEAAAEEPQAEAAAEEPQAEAVVEEPQAEAVVEEPQAEAVEEEPQVEAVEEEPQAEAVEEEPQAEAVVEEPQAEAVVEEPQAEAVVEEPQVKAVEETPVVPVQAAPEHYESRYTHDWEENEKKTGKRHRRRTGMRILYTLLILLIVGALGFVGYYYYMDMQEDPAFLVLPQSVTLQEVTVADTVELKPTDFVSGLDGTGLSVAFGPDYAKDQLGRQEFTLIFTKEGKTCSRTATLYRFQVIPEVTVALGETYQADIRDFVPDKNIAAQFVTSPPDPRSQAGIFKLWISCNDAAYEVQFVITEAIAPTGSGKQVTVTCGETLDPSMFVDNVMDHTPVTITFKEDPRFDLAGERSVTVVLTDLFGNTTEVKSELSVEPHEDGPRFEELKTIYMVVGTPVSYKTGVTVTDPQDGVLTFTVDPGNFDNNTVGKYTVYYTAVDADGHSLTVERHIVVETKEGQQLRMEAQMVLDRIITPGMTRDEMIHAVYEYTRWNVHYLGTYNVRDIEEAAYDGFTKGQGDCFVYYSMIRVMLDMLEIPNVECQRIGGTSNHWWNLVEFEDGLYYHVDATPHGITWLDEHFKLTESVIQEYTANPDVMNHRPNYYVYDHTLPQYQGIEIAQ